MHAIEPLPFWLNDGREAHFKLSMAQVRKAVAGFGGEFPSDQNALGLEMTARVLYAAMVDTFGLSFEEFEALMPADPELITGFYDALKQHCGVGAGDRNEKYRPRKSQA
jgi:hypothetical protein